MDNDITQFPLELAESWLVRGSVGDNVGVSAGSTTAYDGTVTGERDLVKVWVRVISTVFAGFNSLIICVAIIVSIDSDVLLAGAATVLMLSDVWMRVRVSTTGEAGGAPAEPPSTATTEYATRLRTTACLGGVWGFSGRAWDK